MNVPQGATRVSLPPSNVKCPHRVIQFPAGVMKPNGSRGFGFRPTRGSHVPRMNRGYWENQVPFVDGQRLSAATADRSLARSLDEYVESRYRRVEPVTPQNSVLSDGYLSGRCLDSSKEVTSKNGSGVKQTPRIKTSKVIKPDKRTTLQDEREITQSIDLEHSGTRRRNTPNEERNFAETFNHRTKSPDPLDLRHLRWSTSAIGEAFKSSKVGDNSQNTEGNRKIGPQHRNLCVRSEFTFSTYDFYNKHNADSAVPKTGKRRASSDLEDEEIKLSELRNYRRIFSHGGIRDLVKDWAQEAYKARVMQMLFAGPSRDEEEEENETVAPLLAHIKKHSSAEAFPAIFNSMRGNSVTPKQQTRKNSVFFHLPSFEHLPEQERLRKRKIRNFRWYSHMIRAMVRLAANMRELSRELTQKSAYSEFLYILAGARTHAGQEGLPGEEGAGKSAEPQLLFDKSWFSRGRARSRMPPWAIEVMSRPPDRRSAHQLMHLKQLLTTMKSFRENMTEDMRTKMCQVVRYTKCDKGRVVLRQGHIGHDFYFIFSGSVFIQIDIYDAVQEETRTSVENVLRMGEGFGINETEEKQTRLRQEIALLGDGHRTASVICKEPTELCQIDKATFLEVCPALFNQLLQDKVNFAKQFPLFSLWDPEDLQKLCFLSQVLDVPHSTVIEANWARPDFAYFVMKGRVSMLKEFDVTDIEEKARTTRGVQNDSPSDNLKKDQTASGENANKKKYTMFANVGTLNTGAHTELSVLSLEPPKDITPIALVSEGARLLRITVRTFRRIAPRKLCEEYLRKTYKRRTFPSEDDLRSVYLADKSWSAFKTTILQTQLSGLAGAPLASVPATLKGSSGWSRWPGYAVLKKKDKSNVPPPPFDHDEYERKAKRFEKRELNLKGIFEEEEEGEEGFGEDDDVFADEIGYFYDSESSDDQVLRSSVKTPLDDHIDQVKLENDRSNTQNPPKSGSVASWRRRLQYN